MVEAVTDKSNGGPSLIMSKQEMTNFKAMLNPEESDVPVIEILEEETKNHKNNITCQLTENSFGHPMTSGNSKSGSLIQVKSSENKSVEPAKQVMKSADCAEDEFEDDDDLDFTFKDQVEAERVADLE